MGTGNNQLKTGIILNYINLLAGMLIPIAYTPVMLRILGESEYGIFKLAGSVTSYLGLISLGIGSAVGRYLIKAMTEEGREAEERMLGLFVRIFRVISAAAFLVGVVLVSSLGFWYGSSLTPAELSKTRIVVFLIVCNTAISFLASPYISVVSAHERFRFMQMMNIVTTCVGPVLNLVALYLGFASVGMAASTLALGIASQGIYLFYIRRVIGIKPRFSPISRELLREILTFSFWIFVANIVNQLYNSTDTVMIAAVPDLGTRGVAVYNVGATFTGIMLNMTIGISSLLSPKTNKMVFAGASTGELTDLAIRVGRLQGYISILIATGFVAFGKPFIAWYAGADYLDAYWVAVCVMVPNMIPLVQSVCLNIIVAQNRHRFRSLVYLGIAILNVIGTWFLMWTPLGIIGAALMTGIATVCGQGFAMNWYYWKKSGLEMGRFWRVLSRQYIIPVLMCVVTLLLYRWIDFYNIAVLSAGIVGYTGIYCVLNWLFVMNAYEKELFQDIVKKLFCSRFSRRNKSC